MVNQEELHIYVSGVIRPEDIAQDNSVGSSVVADAEIEFVGSRRAHRKPIPRLADALPRRDQSVLIMLRLPHRRAPARASVPAAMAAAASRIEELCDVKGVRPNQLIGYGLVVGLANTGDTGQSQVHGAEHRRDAASLGRDHRSQVDPDAQRSRGHGHRHPARQCQSRHAHRCGGVEPGQRAQHRRRHALANTAARRRSRRVRGRARAAPARWLRRELRHAVRRRLVPLQSDHRRSRTARCDRGASGADRESHRRCAHFATARAVVRDRESHRDRDQHRARRRHGASGRRRHGHVQSGRRSKERSGRSARAHPSSDWSTPMRPCAW